MKKVSNNSKGGKTVITHLKRHHKKYLFGIFGGFALVKMALLFFGFAPINTFANEEGNDGDLVRFVSQPFYTRIAHDEIRVERAEGANGACVISDTGNIESINWQDSSYTPNNGTSAVITLTDQSHNGDYICAFAQKDANSQTICSEFPIQIDSTKPSVSPIFPVNGQSFSRGGEIEISWTGHDDESGLSGYLLDIVSPSWLHISRNSDYNFTNYDDFILNEVGTWTRSVIAYDNVMNHSEASGYFIVANPEDPEPNPNPNPNPQPNPEPSNPGDLVRFVSQPFYTWIAHDQIKIGRAEGANGGYKFSNTKDTGSVDWSTGFTYNNGDIVTINLNNQSHNDDYICAFAQTNTNSQRICSKYSIQIDSTKPYVSLIFPINGQTFSKGGSIAISWTGRDNESGLSGFVLSVSSPSGTSNYNLSRNELTKDILLTSAGTRYRSVTAYDNVRNHAEASGYFVVNNPSNPNTGNNSDPNQNATGDGFFLIRPTLFEEIELGNNITFRWNAGNLNNGYTWSVKKIGGTVISSGFTTGVSITLDNGLFSVGSYSWSVKDISTDTNKDIPLFYVVDSENEPDLEVDQFEFNEIDDADIDEYYKSDKIVIDGLEDGWYTFAYLKNNIGALFINGEFVGTQGIVTNGDNIRIELKASSEYEDTVSTRLIIGTGNNLVSDVFRVTTKGGITGWDNNSLTPMQRLWGAMFVDSLVEMYQYDERKLATFLSTFMQILQDKSDYYAQQILKAQEDGDEELLDEYKLYKNAVDFLYVIVKYRYENIDVEDRTVYIAPNGKQYLVDYDEDRRAYTSPDFLRPKYFPSWESFKNHIDTNNPAVGKWGIVGNVITTHNGKVYTIYETNGKWTSSNFKTKKYFDTKEDIINHILASNPASNWDHTIDTNFNEVVYTAPNGRVYRIFKTSSKGNNPEMYSSYDFVNAKYFTSLEAAKKFIDQNNKK